MELGHARRRKKHLIGIFLTVKRGEVGFFLSKPLTTAFIFAFSGKKKIAKATLSIRRLPFRKICAWEAVRFLLFRDGVFETRCDIGIVSEICLILFPTHQNSLAPMGWRCSSRNQNLYSCHRTTSPLSNLVLRVFVQSWYSGVRSQRRRDGSNPEHLQNRAAAARITFFGTHLDVDSSLDTHVVGDTRIRPGA